MGGLARVPRLLYRLVALALPVAYAVASACQVPDLDERGKSCTSTCPGGLPCIQGVCGGPLTLVDGGSGRDDSGGVRDDASAPTGDAMTLDGGDAATPSRGCAAPTMNRILCEEFSGETIAPAWILGINATGKLVLVEEPAVSKPRALRSEVKGFPSGDDARLFRNFPGPFSHVRVTFDLQIESNAGDFFALSVGDCAFFLGTNAGGVVGRVKHAVTGEEAQATANDSDLVKPSVWRRITVDGAGTTANVSFDEQQRLSIVSPTACNTGDTSLSLGIYAQRGYAAVFIDNISLDVE
jgi:hypothetical protein